MMIDDSGDMLVSGLQSSLPTLHSFNANNIASSKQIFVGSVSVSLQLDGTSIFVFLILCKFQGLSARWFSEFYTTTTLSAVATSARRKFSFDWSNYELQPDISITIKCLWDSNTRSC
jgi:hypothetical protein